MSEYIERLEAVLVAARNLVEQPHTLRVAIDRGDKQSVDEIEFRIALLKAALKELRG